MSGRKQRMTAGIMEVAVNIAAIEGYRKGKRESLSDLPNRLFEGANRYDTDDEHVLTLWADGQTWDIRVPKVEP